MTILLAGRLFLNFEMPEVLVGNGNTQPWCVLRQIQEAIVRGGIAIEDVFAGQPLMKAKTAHGIAVLVEHVACISA